MEDVDLDFLSTPPKYSKPAKHGGSPYVYNRIDVEFGKREHGKKKFELAQSIAKVDELLQEIDKLKNQNNELQAQLKDFQRTANEVQHLYSREKQEKEFIKQNFNSLKEKCEEIDTDLTNKNMVNDQMKARLAEYEGRPINFNNLVVKYVRLMNKLEGDDILKYSGEKDLLGKLKEYCAMNKLKISSSNNSPREKAKSVKIKTGEAFVQCNLYDEISSPYNNQCQSCLHNFAQTVRNTTKDSIVQCNIFAKSTSMKDKNIQCSTKKRDHASQYISTLITRQTNTEKVDRKHVQTMFPEPQSIPSIETILSTYSRWYNIRAVSPLLDSPNCYNNQTNQELKNFTSIGTCTMLCNIRRKIDYLPFNNLYNIKQEIITPSASPTPKSQQISVNRTNISTNINNDIDHPIFNLFNTTGSSSLGQLTSSAFNELWQIFGKMLLSLLQTGNSGIANTNLNSTINQKQFLNWLLDLYMGHQPQSTASAQTQTVEEIDPWTSTSPLCFNDASALSTNIVRPQAQKTLHRRTNSRSVSIDDNSNSHFINQSNCTNSEEFSQDSNLIAIKVKEIHISSNSTEVQDNNCESFINMNSHPRQKGNKSKKNNSKPKRKMLEKLLKRNNHRKKLSDNKKDGNIVNHESEVEFLNESNDRIETAVDFLKVFATKQSTELVQENENIFIENSSHENHKHYGNNEIDSCVVKPSTTSPQRNENSLQLKHLPIFNKDTFLKPVTKCKKLKTLKNSNNKCRLLFGDSDSEADEYEEKFSKQNKEPVIKNMVNLSNNTSIECKKDIKSSLKYNEESNGKTTPTRIGEGQYADNKDVNFSNKNCDIIVQEDSSKSVFKRKQCTSPNILTTVLENSPVKNFKNGTFSLSPPIFNQSESTYLRNPLFGTYFEDVNSSFEGTENISSNIREMLLEDININNCSENHKSNCIENRNKVAYSRKILENSWSIDTNLKEGSAFNSLPNLTDAITENNLTDSKLTISKTSNSKELTISPIFLTQKPRNILVNETNIKSLPPNDDIEESQNSYIEKPNVIYASDFEKDFELSSDNESLISNGECQLNQVPITDSVEKLSEIIGNKNENESIKSTNSISFTISDDDVTFGNQVVKAQDKKKKNCNKNKDDHTGEIIISLQNSSSFESGKDSSSLCWSVISVSDSVVSNDAVNEKDLVNLKVRKENCQLEIDNKITDTKNKSHQTKLNLDNKLEYSTDSEPNGNVKINETNKCYTVAPDASVENNIDDNIADECNNTNESDNNDSWSIENELMIDEDPVEDIEKKFMTEQSSSPSLDINNFQYDTLNSSNISTISSNSLSNEILTESLKPIVGDLLKERNLENPTLEEKPKRDRKRRNESLDELQPCKRSQHLKTKQMILESSLNLINTPIEIGKYTKIPLKVSPCKEKIKNKKTDLVQNNYNFESKYEVTENIDLNKTTSILQIGFFKERQIEATEDAVLKTHKTFVISKSNEYGLESKITFTKSSDSSNGDSIDTSNQYRDHNEIIKIHEFNKNSIVETQGHAPSNDNPNEAEINTQGIIKMDLNEAYIERTDSPQSPTPLENPDELFAKTFVTIPTERPPQYVPHQRNHTLFDILINSYSVKCQKQATKNPTTKERQKQNMMLNELEKHIKVYCYSDKESDLDSTALLLINKLLNICSEYSLIHKSIIAISQKAESTNVMENELPSIIQEMPPRHLGNCLQRLFVVIRNFVEKNHNFCLELIEEIEAVLFTSKQLDKLNLGSTLNLTQLYLMACKVQESIGLQKHPARLFIVKCLYYYIQKANLMIHEVLLWYPTVLPYREDRTYDRSDALISVINYILMNTKYDMYKPDLRGRSLLSKLRYEYHFEPFKPKSNEVICILVDKLKNNEFCNLFLAFGLLCKRLGINYTKNVILIEHLLPLAQEYYGLALKTNEYDNRIAVLLEIISMILKPLPYKTDVNLYINEFSRFLNGFERPIIQEAALCSILRLQRFGVDNCYNALRHFQLNFELKTHTQAMLKTFLYRRSLAFWKSKQSQNSITLAN